MQSSSSPIVKDLVLIGGGHSHAIVLKQFGMNPLPGVRLTLITNVSNTPYSGMLPGYVAGIYSFDDCHIDLRPLSQFAGASMIVSAATGLDLVNQRVLLANRPPIAFDLLSIDIGSTPATLLAPGAKEYAIPVKPIAQFLQYWDQLVTEVQQCPDRPIRVGIVGGGAGGVELALAAQSRLHQIYQEAQQPLTNLTMHLFQRGDRLISERNRWVSDRLQQILQQRRVNLHLQQTVAAVEKVTDEIQVQCESGLSVACDVLFWVTQASAANWLYQAGLATDEKGFLQITNTLQSVSHPQVFAAGDVATMTEHPRPKAGVFAVRQGKPLYENLRRSLLGQPLKPFVPQKEFLILVGTGDRSALASRGAFGLDRSPLLWQWKDWIDRRFMAKFSHLEPMSNFKFPPQRLTLSDSSVSPTLMHCAGCGSKVGSTILERTLNRIQKEQPARSRSDILVGLDAADDAAVVSVPADRVLVQTVDHFRTLVNDPFIFGQICANHCLSDLFAMAAEPQSALAIVTLPYAIEAKLEETLYQLLSGAIKVLHGVGAVLTGGHTTEGNELAFGLTCNGIANPDRLWRKSGMQPGEALILTKPIGTGTLFAADMQLRAKGRWIEGAIESMLQSNGAAAICFQEHQATACTDITGFGLLGHLLEMVKASQVRVELDLNALPVLDGAKETTQQGILSSLHPQNVKASRYCTNLEVAQQHPLYPLLFDPQTSGGLLASVPSDRADACLAGLKAIGYTQSRIIGVALPSAGLPSEPGLVTLKT